MSALSASGQVLQRADARMELGLWKFIGGRGGGDPVKGEGGEGRVAQGELRLHVALTEPLPS